MMKYYFFLVFLLSAVSIGFSQSDDLWIEGKVSYSNAQNIYVTFNSTEGIKEGDTLYLRSSSIYEPAVVVKFSSSISCVCQPLISNLWNIDTPLFFKKEVPALVEETSQDTLIIISEPEPLVDTPDSVALKPNLFEQKLRGRLSTSSYTGIEDFQELTSQRMRYSFSLYANHIKDSRISFQNYITFRHKWEDKIQNTDQFFDALKIYNLAIGFKPNERNEFWLGRRVNNHITNIGAIDGIQYAHVVGNYSFGGFAGTRPDYRDYRISTELPQFGAYVAHQKDLKNGYTKSTISVVEQRNHGFTDRRFLYFQHSNSIIKKLHMFSSFEVDLFKSQNGEASSAFLPRSLYVSLRYRPNRKFSIYGAYDNRRRVIYYESYKHLVDQLLEEETRQGFRLRMRYRLTKKLSLGASGNYRFQTNSVATRNLYGYLGITRIPGIKLNARFSYNYLETSYLQGQIFGLRANRDLIRGKLSSSFNFRHVRYLYKSSESHLNQSIAGINLSWRIKKTISLSLNYEGSFQPDRNYSRIYVNVVKRIR